MSIRCPSALTEQGKHVHRAFSTLSRHQRQVLALRVVAGLNAEETGRIVGYPAVAVRLIQHQALNRLRRAIGDPAC